MNSNHLRPLRALAVVGSLALFVSFTGYRPSAVPPAPTPVPQALTAISAASLPLSGAWRFSVDADKTGETNGWAEPDFDDSAWTAVTVPHTWGVIPESADYSGLGWYRRRFTLPPEAMNAHLRLRFEAVFYLTRVWLNGKYLGEYAGGYTPFDFDVSRIAQPGPDNVLVVQVDKLEATDRSSATLNAVSLEVTSRAFIARQAIVAVPHLSGVDEADSATITTTVTLHNTSVDSLIGLLTATILDKTTGQPMLPAPSTAPVSLAPGHRVEIQLTAALALPQLWRASQPSLYRWVTTLTSANAKQLHVVEETFGIRLTEFAVPEADDVPSVVSSGPRASR